MTVYYVLAIAFVVFALGLTAIGLTRADFPPNPIQGRVLMGIALIVAIVTFGVLVANTHTEHPREEAAAEVAERKAEGEDKGGVEGTAGGQEAGAEQAPGGPVEVVEDEYSIEIPSGEAFEAGPYAFEPVNEGEQVHDLAIQGPAVARKQTDPIEPGESATLEARLEPGRYTLWCTIGDHRERGMETEIEVE